MTNGEKRLYSVTTLIDEAIRKKALENWLGNFVAEYAVDNVEIWRPLAEADREGAIKLIAGSRYRKSGKAMERGSQLHAAAEQLALGFEPTVDDIVLPYVEQYRAFLDDHRPEFLAAEAPVYSLAYHYAGTMDGIIRVDGRVCIFDTKTTEKAPDAPSRPPYPEVALQLAAYAHADLVGVDQAAMRNVGGRRYYIWTDEMVCEPMPEVDGGLCLMVSPYDYRLVPVNIGDETWQAFLHVREVARWQLDTSQRVLGPTITPPAREPA